MGNPYKNMKNMNAEYWQIEFQNLLKKYNILQEVFNLNVKQFEKALLENNGKNRHETLREVLDALYENESDELCITQKQYKKWEDELLD